MGYYYKYRIKTKKLYFHQIEFVRQACEARRDGKRITVRTPKLIEKYLNKDVSNLVVRLLAEHFSTQRSAFENYTEEELCTQLEGI